MDALGLVHDQKSVVKVSGRPQFNAYLMMLITKRLGLCFEAAWVISTKQADSHRACARRFKKGEKRMVTVRVNNHQLTLCIGDHFTDRYKSVPLRIFWEKHLSNLWIQRDESVLLKSPPDLLKRP